MKKIIDDRGRLFGRVSVIDVFVLIVAVVLIAAAYMRFSIFENPVTSPATVDVTYTVRIPAVRMSAAMLMRPGDRLFSTETGANIGTITNVDITDSLVPEPLVDGTWVLARAHERYDVLLTVSAQCSYSNGRYYADRTFELNANSENRIHTKYNEFVHALIMTITAE